MPFENERDAGRPGIPDEISQEAARAVAEAAVRASWEAAFGEGALDFIQSVIRAAEAQS